MMIPLTTGMTMTGDFQIEGQPPVPGQALPVADFRVISPNYFETLHIPILEGRAFTRADRPGAPDVAIVNRSAAQHFGGTVVRGGQRFSVGGGEVWVQVAGAVG